MIRPKPTVSSSTVTATNNRPRGLSVIRRTNLPRTTLYAAMAAAGLYDDHLHRHRLVHAHTRDHRATLGDSSRLSHVLGRDDDVARDRIFVSRLFPDSRRRHFHDRSEWIAAVDDVLLDVLEPAGPRVPHLFRRSGVPNGYENEFFYGGAQPTSTSLRPHPCFRRPARTGTSSS